MIENTHSCSYFCSLPGCIKAQRDELREDLRTALDDLTIEATECIALRQRVADLEGANGTLRAFLEYESTCPCCNTTDVCVDGCTFAIDLPDAADRMQEVRAVLRATEV